MREVQRLLLTLHVVFGDDQIALVAAQINVGDRHFRKQRHQRVAAILDGGLDVAVGGFDVARDRAEDVQLPGGVESTFPEAAVSASTIADGNAIIAWL